MAQKCNRAGVDVKSKGNYPDVYDDLRELRLRADSGVVRDIVARLPTLCRLLGRGDPYLAVGELRDLLSTLAAAEDREVLAFYYSLTPGKDSTDRIREAGERLHVEYRRARDLSDFGLLKVAEIIGSNADWQVPFMRAAVDVHDSTVEVSTAVTVRRGFKNYRHPKHLLDGEEVSPSHVVDGTDTEERYVYGPVTFEVGEGQRTFRVRRIGSHRMRTHVAYRSNNPNVIVSSLSAYLTAGFAFELEASGDVWLPALRGEKLEPEGLTTT